jgi:hypothetical protein
MVQVPVPTVRTVDPDTLHTCGVSEVNDTGRAESGDADADKATGSPTGTPGCTASGGGAKLIVCGACPVVTWNDCVTGVAAA